MTRQSEIKKLTKLVDTGSANPLRLGEQIVKGGQGKGGTRIHDDAWSEFIIVAKHLYSINEEAEVADVFEVFRTKVLGGEKYSPSTLERADREVATDCGPW